MNHLLKYKEVMRVYKIVKKLSIDLRSVSIAFNHILLDFIDIEVKFNDNSVRILMHMIVNISDEIQRDANLYIDVNFINDV